MTWRMNRLGRRFMWASLGVLAVAVITIVVAAQQMFISDQDLGFLLWIMIPATVAAALAAYLLSTPIARDARRLSDAATQVAAGDLAARSGVRRTDELGDAALAFDRMVARLEAVEQERAMMLSSISHDLRTPLAALRASVEAIRDGVAQDPDALLGAMERQVQALAVLVDDLQLHTRIASGTLDTRIVRHDLAELVDEVVESVRPLANGRTFVTHGPGAVPVDADPAQMGRVLRNLYDNAIRHSPPAGSIRTELQRSEEADPAGARWVVLTVRDDGPGFPPDLAAVAFEPFTRGDPARDVATGTAGLGLAIARGIVAAHGGTIEIGPGPGGEVRVRLPSHRGP